MMMNLLQRQSSAARGRLISSRLVVIQKNNKNNLHHHLHHKCQFFSTATTTLDKKVNVKKKTLWLYRILLRQSNALFENKEKEWLLQPPLNPRDYGQAQHFSSSSSFVKSENCSSSSKLYHIFNWFRIHQNLLQDEEQQQHNSQSWQWWLSVIKGIDTDDWEEVDDDDDDSSLDCLWVSKTNMRDAIRHSFRTAAAAPETMASSQGLAIQAVRLLNEQESMVERTSISTNIEHGVRVVATSRCIGTASLGGSALRGEDPLLETTKHRFAYRIRVENLPENNQTVQLLGRTWHIEEVIGEEPPVTVNAPTTGAVGHLPVLKPGQVFEYMSGCELATTKGFMNGCFHMAVVDEKTKSAMVGDIVDAFSNPTTTHFKVSVEPFDLIAK